MDVTLTIQRTKVYDEVAKTTEYAAAKKAGDDGSAYDRIKVVDENDEALGRFWDECRSDVTYALMRNIKIEGMYESESAIVQSPTGDYYKVKLDMTDNFSAEFKDALEKGLFSYFVNSIVAKWYAYTNKDDVKDTATMALNELKNIILTLNKRVRPERPE